MTTAAPEFDVFYGNASPTTDSERVDWARRAAKRAKAERIKWQAIARMITRRPDLKLELTGSTPRTDGNTIWIRVPIELGNPVEHIRQQCGKRGSDLIMTCPGCAVLDDVTITILHECAHIAHDSFADLEEDDKIGLIRDAIRLEAKGLPESRRIKKIERAFQQRPPRHYYNAASTISPWLQMILNALDDGRVNKAMMEARPGTRSMFGAQTNRVFMQGLLRADGSRSFWRDAPPNLQAVISLYCKTSSIDYTTYLDPEIVDRVDDAELDRLCQYAATARTIKSLYRISIQALERLRELDFCRTPDDEEDDPEPEPMGDESDQSEQTNEDKPSEGDQGEPQQGESEGQGGSADDSDDESGSESSDQSGDEQSGGSDDSDGEPQDGDEQGSGGSGSSDDASEPQNGGKGDDEDGADDSSESSDESSESSSESSDSDTDTDSDLSSEDDGYDGEGDDDFRDGEQTEGNNQGHGVQEEHHDFGDEADGDTPERDATDGSADEYDDDDESDEDRTNPEYRRRDEYTEEDYDADGRPEDVEEQFRQFGRHDEDGHVTTAEDQDSFTAGVNEEEVERAIVQGDFFDAPSDNVYGVDVHRNLEGPAWNSRWGNTSTEPIKIDEKILSPALMRLRLIFDDNRRWSHERNMDSGRLDSKTLYRLPTGDDRIFHRRIKPGKKDWFVLIGLDVSGSTADGAIKIIKQAAFAKAELCARLGVKFAVYAHTGEYAGGGYGRGVSVGIYEIKAPNEPWGKREKDRLAQLGSSGGNLDGHTLEFYRKVCQQQDTTDKVILYYTDGAMPMSNYEEELEVLQHNIKLCDQLGIQLVGVGIKNDDPTEHGLDTVRLDHVSDVPKVVKELEKRLKR